LNKPLAQQICAMGQRHGAARRFGTSFVYKQTGIGAARERFFQKRLQLPRLASAGYIDRCRSSIVGASISIGWATASRPPSLSRMTIRFLHGVGHPLLAGLRRRLQYVGAISSREFILQPMSFANSGHAEARLADHLRRGVRRACLQHAVERGNLLDVLRQPYIEAARAKGLPGPPGCFLKHPSPTHCIRWSCTRASPCPYMLSGELEVAIVLGIRPLGR